MHNRISGSKKMVTINMNNIMFNSTHSSNKKKASDLQNIRNQLHKKYPMKSQYNSVIPLNIFQTWHTKALCPGMQTSVETIIRTNPEFKYYLFDDDDCAAFIKSNFDEDVYNAFNSLVPGAYKADLWRYCVLYKEGGIYLDIKYRPINGFRCIDITENEHWVLDTDKNRIYNALMVCKLGNPILLKAIEMIVQNVKNKYYGDNALYPTGPALLGQLFSSEEKQLFDMYHDYLDTENNRFIYYNNRIIFKSYEGYIQDCNNQAKRPYYYNLWQERKVYS